MSIGVIVPAAGQGKRMGTKESKQFLLFHDEPVLLHTLRIFETYPEVTQIVVVTKTDEVERTRQLIADVRLQKVTHVIPGGKERQESVSLGLAHLVTDFVFVHDAVRPFVSHEAIARLVTAVHKYGAAILAVPMKDTVKLVNEAGIVEATPDRNRLWSVQTPQAFRLSLLREAYRSAGEGLATDDAMLVEQLGQAVHVVEGEYTNIKLTTPDDLILAEAIYQKRRREA